MSFFGFDTSLPPEKPASKTGIDDPFDPTFGEEEDDDAAFEEKLRGLRAAGQEDVEIYTWGGAGDGEGGDDGLGDLLDETGDDFNDDTFGFGGDVGKDFDFTGGKGAKQGQAQGSLFFHSATAPDTSDMGRTRKNDAAFASTMDDFWRMPDVMPSKPPAPPAIVQQSQEPKSQGRTFQDGEALLRDQSKAQAEVAAAPPVVAAQPSAARRPLTMEEVEAEMRARRAQQSVPTQQQAPLPAVVQANAALSDAAFPPLGSSPAQIPAQQQYAQQHSQQQLSTLLPFMRSLPPIPDPNDPNAQAAMFARMRAMLETLPNPIQARILALPPYMHFGATESVVRDFPALTVAASQEKLPQQLENSRLWPRIDGSLEEQNTIRFMVDTAMAKIDEAHRMESRRQIRLAKIRAMALRNNLMSRSDKDFITRIQVSQLITSDPYTDDFYAHIYFALHGNTNRVSSLGTDDAQQQRQQLQQKQQQQQAKTEESQAGEQQGQRKGNKRKQQQQQQVNRRETAMLRMQQQVERIVQNRKERIEKAAGSATLEGALGRVSLSTTKAPRQMLQVNKESDDVDAKGQAQDDQVGVGHAQNAVQQALKGASLAQNTGGASKRPALTTFEALSILERLYDIVLSLEQSRRTAPADSSEQNADPAAIEWRTKRDELVQALWTELRVLEPLEVSDPHPFVSLLSTIKGKKLLPRALRHLSNEQTLTAMTMIVASFDRLDVVQNSVLLDDAPSSMTGARAEKRADAQRQTDAFATSIVPTMLTLMSTVPMRIVSGMLALFIQRNDPVRVAQSKAGVSFLTIFLSRAASLRQQSASNVTGSIGTTPPNDADATSQADLAQWAEIFNLLVQRLTQPPVLLTTLFPSTRAKARLPFGVPSLDAQRKSELEVQDRDVWQLMAAMAVSADMTQQQLLVTGLREKILENVLEAKQWSQANPAAASSGEADLRIRNVNLLLHALNLDAAQITV